MQRWQADEFGDVQQVLHLQEVEMPRPSRGEALVRVLTASIALPDLMMVRGDYPLVPAPPVSPGQEVVGIVERAAEDFPHPVGARIAANARSDIAIGGLAQYTLVPGWSALPVIAGLNDEQAVGFSGSFQVAHIGLQHRAGLSAEETLLVLGGAGRTGSAAIQVGKAMGARVIATARTAAKADFCRAQGADHVLDLTEPSTESDIAGWTGGRGVDVVYDTVGGTAHTHAVRHLSSAGARVLVVGFASGQKAALDAQDLLFRDYSVIGVSSAFRNQGERLDTVRALTAMLEAGSILPPVTSVHPFDEVPLAIAQRAQDATGQSVIRVAFAPERS